MNFKKFWVSLVAVLCSINLVAGLVAHSEEEKSWLEIIEETIFSLPIQASGIPVDSETAYAVYKGLTGLEKAIYGEMLGYMITKNPLIQPDSSGNNKLSFTIPNYDILTGKYMLHWTLLDGTQDDILVECTVILSDTPEALVNLPPVQVPEYGDVYYYANALNFAITHSDGTLNRYIVSYPTGMNYTSPTFTSNMYSISAQSGCTLWEYRGGSDLSKSRPLQTPFYCQNVRFNTSTVNSIRVDLEDIYTQTDSTYQTKPSGFYSYSSSAVSANNYLPYPVDVDICHGIFNARYDKLGSNGFKGAAIYCNREFKTSFAITNNSSKGNNLNRYWITPQTQNYYYNDYIQGGTTINETNVNNYFDGALLPAFDIDPDLPLADILDILTDLLPDLQVGMKPTLDLSIRDLFDRLVDFYGNMPDINLDWDTPLDNDYWDIEFPPIPDSGGGGSGGDITVYVTVDITRPLITTYQYTDPLELASLPQITTYTMPVAVQDSAKSILDTGEDVLQDSGLIPIYAFLTLIGIGIAIIFKGV